MELYLIIFIALGLSMDAFAVSISTGMTIRCTPVEAFKVAFFFGFFQFIMPVAGWAGAIVLSDFISKFAHWIAFLLLAGVGIKMIYESMEPRDKEVKCRELSLKYLFLLAVATSIDALAVGISFAFLKISIIMPVLIIGVVTFSLSFAGVYIGKRFGHFFENRLEMIGGIILIFIGIKIIIEHIFLN